MPRGSRLQHDHPNTRQPATASPRAASQPARNRDQRNKADGGNREIRRAGNGRASSTNRAGADPMAPRTAPVQSTFASSSPRA